MNYVKHVILSDKGLPVSVKVIIMKGDMNYIHIKGHINNVHIHVKIPVQTYPKTNIVLENENGKNVLKKNKPDSNGMHLWNDNNVTNFPFNVFVHIF